MDILINGCLIKQENVNDSDFIFESKPIQEPDVNLCIGSQVENAFLAEAIEPERDLLLLINDKLVTSDVTDVTITNINQLLTHTGEKPFNCYNDGVESSNCMITPYPSHNHRESATQTDRDEDVKPLDIIVKQELIPHTSEEEINEAGLVFVLNNQIQIDSNKRVCTLCGFQNKRLSVLKRHMMIHTGEKPYKCTYCNFRTAVKDTLNGHITIHTGERKYKCDQCDFTARVHQNLRSHKYTHLLERPFKCHLCKSAFKMRYLLTQHMKRSHNDGNCYKCDECSYSANLKSDVQNHKKIHTGHTLLKCKYCEFKATCEGNMRAHIPTHHTHKPIKCDICDFKTNRRSTLITHKFTHATEKPFKCTDCNKCFADMSILNAHMKKYKHMHSVPKSLFKCDQCNYETNEKRIFLWHSRIHLGEKIFECKLCEYKTNFSSNLIKHNKIHKEIF